MPVSGRDPVEGWGIHPTANDRLKAGHAALARRAAGVSILAHLLFLLGLPNWTGTTQLQDPLRESIELESVTVIETSTGPEGGESAAFPQMASLDSIPLVSGAIGDPSAQVAELAGISEIFRDRLARATTLAPTLSEPDAEVTSTEDESSSGSEGDPTGLRLAELRSSAALPEWLGSAPLDLDRLSAVRPDVVFVTPSSWVLLRNPVEVERFMRQSLARSVVEANFSGSVAIALWIDERGAVEWAEISRSSGRTELDQMALALFSEVASFRPAREGGVPVPVSVIFHLNFPWF